MTIHEQIVQDVETVTRDTLLRSKLFDFLQSLKATSPQQPNKDKILSFAGTIDDNEATEVLKIIADEFNRIDGEWH
ncbi:hypothetical protein [Dyadobacter jiangsuensis]|uniref:Uncharacterized protein n=1 Tax=Dyadobacter jiangsuensis TaxID=1591085 RepID=A0A2P8FMT5_9BACT|nr:hypothetical protein [Dyadobacter jiangsuensis]PSL22965.1 hypothetical protein CLV60_11897 [Dyadobacter jiangsuensis]